MSDKQILKSIKALARGECPNYCNGLCLETNESCHIINEDDDTVHHGRVNCDYFCECVLPGNWDMNDLISYALWYGVEDENDSPVNNQ